MSDNKKVCIIGAGASGLMAAVSAARCGASVVVYEHKSSAGMKLLLTGNGKCNFTNMVMNQSCYYNEKPNQLMPLIARFNNNDVIAFFTSIGLLPDERNGYVYPSDGNAQSVLDCLLNDCRRLGVDIIYECGELDIHKLRKDYDSVIIATGGRSYPRTGSNGTGYKFLERLGIRYSRVLPALCAIYVKDKFIDEHKGERLLADVSVLIEDKGIFSNAGELQLVEYGISGIPVFQISRYVSKALYEEKKVEIRINFNPDIESIPDFLRDRQMKPELGEKVFVPEKTAGFDKAQVCTGGVSLDQLDENLQLLDAPGVYLAGEIIDVDGICGGYNLQWAWTSGWIAGGGACLG